MDNKLPKNAGTLEFWQTLHIALRKNPICRFAETQHPSTPWLDFLVWQRMMMYGMTSNNEA